MDISKTMRIKLTFSSKVYEQLTQKLSIIDTFKGSWKARENAESLYLRELRKVATIESVGSSTRIEGVKLTDEEIEKLLTSVRITKLESRDDQEVVGYYEALQIILDNYEKVQISENYIHQLHGFLLKHSHKDQSHKGKYKTLPNQVIANYPDGTRKIIFETTPPHLVPGEIHQLLTWINQRLKHKDMHPLITTAAFVYEFLSIHPYQDGNGRLSRLLTTLLLLKLDYGFVQYVSFENVIEAHKDEYYKFLMAGQKNRGTKSECIDAWVLFFVQSLIILTDRLETKYKTLSKLKTALNKRQKLVLEFVRKHEPIKIGDLEKGMSNFSRNTLKKDLAYLVREGILIKTGERRGTIYHIKKE